MRVLKATKIVLKNKKYEKLIDSLPIYFFNLCQGFVIRDANFETKEIKVEPVVPLDFEESRIVKINFKNKIFELKGAGRVTKNSIEEIDAFGPYETGPPGGLFLEFAKKEFKRYKQIEKFVKTVNIPLAVIQLPYEFEFKSISEEKIRKRKLAMILRLVICKKRIEELCYEKNPKMDVKKFCQDFGKNIHNLLFKAKRTHFALWDGGDVGIDGSIADYDSIHNLNEKDLADTIDGCFTTILRLCGKTNFDSNVGLQIFLKEVCKKEFGSTPKKMFEQSVDYLIQKLLNKKPSQGILIPKFTDKKHAVYYSQYAIERNLKDK